MNRTIIFTLTSVIGLGACTASASNDAPAAKATPSTMVNDVAYTPVCHRVSPAFKEAISSALTESYKDASVGDGFYIRTGATIGPRVPRLIYESAVEIDGTMAVFGDDFTKPSNPGNTADRVVAANPWADSVTTLPSQADPEFAHSGWMHALTDPSNVVAAETCF